MSAHIQYELDALNAATAIANVAKLGRQWVVAGLADMWAHCFRSHTDEVSDMQLAGFFSEPIGPVLEGFGFLERVGDGRWRVKGTGRYVSLSEKRKAAGSKGGKATQASSKTPPKPASEAGFTEAKSSKGGFAQANDKQTTHEPAVASASKQATGQANGENAGANQALKPRSDISPPTGERDINTRVELREGAGAQPALGGAGSPAQAASVEPPEGDSPKRAGEGPQDAPGRRKATTVPAELVRCLPGAGKWPSGAILTFPRREPMLEPGTPEWDAVVAESRRRGWE